jgi:hypothetical protein
MTSAGDSTAATTRHVHRMAEPVPGQYIVEVHDVPAAGVKPFADVIAREYHGKVRALFTHANTAFAIDLIDQEAERLANHPSVSIVEEVAVVHSSASPQLNAPWQLDRIDQPTGLDGVYAYSDSGVGTYIYVIGQGVYRDHDEFALDGGQSRVLRGAKFATDDSIRPGDLSDYGYWPCGSPGGLADSTGNGGHDTAVASFAAGLTQGVAKDAYIVPIRTFPCSGEGNTVWMNYAVDWIMDPSQNPYYNAGPAVVNISAFFVVCDGVNTVNASTFENEINSLVGHPYVSNMRSRDLGRRHG